VEIIGLSIIILLVLITTFTIIAKPVISIKRCEKGSSPRKVSYVVIGILVVNWIFFLGGGYALLPRNIADAIFMPMWLVLCLAGLGIVIFEFKNSQVFSIFVAGFVTISLLFSVFINGISNM
jgi:hypothetical protein